MTAVYFLRGPKNGNQSARVGDCSGTAVHNIPAVKPLQVRRLVSRNGVSWPCV